MNIRQLRIASRDKLSAAGSESPAADVDCLMSEAFGKDRSWLMIHDTDEATSEKLIEFDSMLARRLNGEPIAYITGHREFWSLRLKCSPATLIPRPDTETLVEEAIRYLSAMDHKNYAPRVLDLGTGTGAIALAIKSEIGEADVLGTDISHDAVELAKTNAEANQLSVSFYASDWFKNVEGKFDLIVSNPPYIAANDKHLSQGDVRFEPETALVSGADGLDDIRIIADNSKKHLNAGGCLMIEHGWDQGSAVREILFSEGYADIRTVRDLGGNDRVTTGRIAK